MDVLNLHSLAYKAIITPAPLILQRSPEETGSIPLLHPFRRKSTAARGASVIWLQPERARARARARFVPDDLKPLPLFDTHSCARGSCTFWTNIEQFYLQRWVYSEFILNQSFWQLDPNLGNLNPEGACTDGGISERVNESGGPPSTSTVLGRVDELPDDLSPTESVPGSEGLGLTQLCWLSKPS